MSLSWSVPELLQHQQEGFAFHEKVLLPLELFRSDPEVRKISAVDVKGVVEFAKGSLTFHLQISGTMVLPCAVTLVNVDYPFDIGTSETFLLDGANDPHPEEDDVHHVDGECIDLTPYLVEAILVEKPIRVVSKQAEHADMSGDGWTLMTERTAEEQIDPRLEKLKEFFDE
ncbi:MAG: YceD family protein [Sporolactobacillus sp.]|jgi:uncharacterized protein|nr:YceD family protein [Sporolactobacillus sp.]